MYESGSSTADVDGMLSDKECTFTKTNPLAFVPLEGVLPPICNSTTNP